ncbi:hypothetical protein AC579_9111 [Pseudocercospora musae]|uniref:Uncharacterized protein n=1 Tax=Pseudocercospora musae TaxID=113226 RepID=A0A139IJ26_9PEZI|nr:hypothetical protein AC579_9111 [Pseudocercospora musae]
MPRRRHHARTLNLAADLRPTTLPRQRRIAPANRNWRCSQTPFQPRVTVKMGLLHQIVNGDGHHKKLQKRSLRSICIPALRPLSEEEKARKVPLPPLPKNIKCYRPAPRPEDFMCSYAAWHCFKAWNEIAPRCESRG